MPAIITQKHKNGIVDAVGSATVLKTTESRVIYTNDEHGERCMFSAVVNMEPTGGYTENGRREYDATVMTFLAYGERARYCYQNLKRGSTFLFAGTMKKNTYWTERLGHDAFSVTLVFCMAEPVPGPVKDGPGNSIQLTGAEDENAVDMIFGEPEY